MPRIHPDRTRLLNERSRVENAEYVLYWMQQSQRAAHNPALEWAVRRANEEGLPLLVVFGLTDDYPEANLRHYTFMLEGLRETKVRLEDRGIRMVIRRGSPDKVSLSYAQDAAVLVTDRGYLRHQKRWRRQVSQNAPCPVEQVEGDVVVPVETVTDKAEYAARTIRPKIHEHLERFLSVPDPVTLEKPALDLLGDEGLTLDTVEGVTDEMGLDPSVHSVSSLYRGGTSEAERILDSFLANHLTGYDENRNQIQSTAVSHMSKYLHFGQISPVWLAGKIRDAEGPQQDIDSYIEELVVRRELAMNHVHFRPDTYDSYKCLPD